MHQGFVPFAEGIWTATAPVRVLGMKLTSTMTVLRLVDGKLLLHSPIAMTPERRASVEALGTVAHLYAPNLFHHLRVGEWATAFPSARLHAPVGLEKKRPDLRIDRFHHSTPEPDFANILEEWPIEGFRLGETVLLHQPTSTLIVADLVHNVGQPEHGWTKFYSKLMGFYDRVALSRMIRWSAFSDRKATRSSLDRLLTQSFDNLIVGHGMPLMGGAKEAITAAFTWLPSPSRA